MVQAVQPIFILPEGTQRTTGKNAQKNNFAAAKAVAETVRTTLGPKGCDKMIVDSLGDITITNDGVTILEEMQVEHPAAKMLVEVAKTQEQEIGDGTTTAVILAGELLAKAEDLIDKDIHPTVIARGYRLAEQKANEYLNSIAKPVKINDVELLKQIAATAITGKGAEVAKEKLSEIAVNAVLKVIDIEDGKVKFDKENIKLEKKVGACLEDTQIIDGIVLEKEAVHPAMPKSVKNAQIALLDCPIEIKETEIDAKIQITDPNQIKAFVQQEEAIIKDMVEKIAASGANVVFCQKGIDDLAQYLLAKKGIYAARRIKKSDMEALVRATGGKIITRIDDLTPDSLGKAKLVEERKFGEEELTFCTDCKNPKAVSILIRGGTEHVVEEAKRAMSDAIGDVVATLQYGKIVGGAGSTEIELARHLRKYAEGLAGREQLAVTAFAEALENIPRTLAENAGLDPIDTITELKAAHDKGKTWAGLNVFTGKVIDAVKEGVIEPLKIKQQALVSASEAAQMILRIDDVIAGAKKETPSPKMPGAGEYEGIE